MTGWLIFLCLCILYDYTHVLGSTCTSGTFRAVPGTGCKSYHQCSKGEWYFLKEDCTSHHLWDNALTTCMPEHQVDTATCTAKHDTGTSGGSGAQSHSDCGNTKCHHGQCNPNHPDKCICNTGYTGDHCDLQMVDNQYCNNNCHHGQCAWNITSHLSHCECNSGYHGYYCNHLYSTTTGGGSHSHSSCDNTRCYHGHCDPYHPDKCICNNGYLGDQCSYQVISNGYCHNYCQHGKCVWNMHTNRYHCECDSGYHGSHCTAVDGGVTNTYSICGNTSCYHGYCDPSHPDRCICDDDHRGSHCDLRVVDNYYCYDNCQFGVCILDIHINSYHCSCDYGYHGNYCEYRDMTSSKTAKTATTSTTSTTSTPVQCLDLELRTVPNTGCQYFEICVNSKWHQPPNKCNDGYLWDDNMKSCQPESNVDQNTCKTLHSAV